MKKKWNVLTIVSLILIVAEIVVFFVLILPSMRMSGIFSALEKADGEKASEYVEKISEKKLDELDERMADFATYQCNQYAAGSITYDELQDIFDAIEMIDRYEYGFTDEYYNEIAYVELLNIYLEGVECYNTDSDKYYELSNEFSDIYYDLYDTSVADDKLIEYVQAKFNSFLAGECTEDEINAYIEVADYYFGGSAWDYIFELRYDRLDNILSYRAEYEEIKGYYDDEDYFTVIERCDEITVDEDDTEYQELYSTLRDDAYETGKTYYIEYAQNLISNGDRDGAMEIAEKLNEVYGDEVDTSVITDALKAPWMDAYAEFMSNYEENIKNDLASATNIDEYHDCATVLADYDTYAPEIFVLHDFDGNGTPEMMLVGEYATYVYGFDGTSVVFTGCMSFYDFGYDSTIVTDFMISPPANYVDGYGLMRFENNTWTVVEYYMELDDGSYIVNGSTASYEEAEAVYLDIASYQDTATSNSIDYCYINSDEEYMDFIYDYE